MNDDTAVAALGALAQATRLKIFRLLVEAGPDGMAAGAISAALAVPAPTLSFHLMHMKHAGLIASRRDSRSLIYAADFAAMTNLLGYLTDNCCGGNPAACGVSCAPATAIAEPAVRRARRRR